MRMTSFMEQKKVMPEEKLALRMTQIMELPLGIRLRFNLNDRRE